jgi:hypothetical protein
VYPSVIPDTVHVAVCAGDSVFAGGVWQTTRGFFTDSFQSSFGCDSLLITEIKVVDDFISNLQISLCEGDSLFAGGAWQKVSGVYIDNHVSAGGCDSVVTSMLSFIEAQVTFDSISITEGDSIYIGGAWLTMPGIYSATLASSDGCDSIIVTELTVLTGIAPYPHANYVTVHPNPSSSGFTIGYSLAAADKVEITLFSISGKIVQTIFNDTQTAGRHWLEFSQRPEAGIYLMSLNTSSFSKMIKVIAF